MYLDPPRISGATDLHSDVDGVSGLPELLLTNEAPPTYEVKVNSTVMMGKLANLDSVYFDSSTIYSPTKAFSSSFRKRLSCHQQV